MRRILETINKDDQFSRERVYQSLEIRLAISTSSSEEFRVVEQIKLRWAPTDQR